MSEIPRSIPCPILIGMLLSSLVCTSHRALANDLNTQGIDVNTGTHAARLTVGACTAGDVILPDGTLANDPGVEPCGKLAANDVDIAAGSAVHFRAGGSIALGESFSVGAGAGFTAKLGATNASWTLAGTLAIPDVLPVGGCFGGSDVAINGSLLAAGCWTNSGGYENEGVVLCFGDAIFSDGFESGDTSAWTSSTP